jgi:hypothetical protein
MKAKTTLHVVPGGDHSLAVRGRQKDVAFEGVLDVVARLDPREPARVATSFTSSQISAVRR